MVMKVVIEWPEVQTKISRILWLVVKKKLVKCKCKQKKTLTYDKAGHVDAQRDEAKKTKFAKDVDVSSSQAK